MKNINKLADKVGKMVVRNNIGSSMHNYVISININYVLTAPILKIFNLEENFQNPPPVVPQGPKLIMLLVSCLTTIFETWEELKLNLGPLEERYSTEGNKVDQNIKLFQLLKYVNRS